MRNPLTVTKRSSDDWASTFALSTSTKAEDSTNRLRMDDEIIDLGTLGTRLFYVIFPSTMNNLLEACR